MPNDNRKTITFANGQIEKIHQARKEEGRNFSNMVQRIITEWFEELHQQNE